MKNLFRILFLLILGLSFGCEKDEPTPKVDENGLTREITDLVPEYILDEMRGLGMPINGGANPPDIEAVFKASPIILLSSNRASDTPGSLFNDYTVTFSGQDNNKLTIMVDYDNEGESGSGIGSYIVGDDCEFSVFVEVNSMISGSPAKLIHVISGKLTHKGIEGFHLANFMLDNFDNPSGVWINNGEGRVFNDSDEFSERVGLSPSDWPVGASDCPCNYEINEEVKGVPLIAQPNNLTCWAASTAMMLSWKNNTVLSIEDALSGVSDQYLELFLNSSNYTGALPLSESTTFFEGEVGLSGLPMSYSIDGIRRLIEDHGPLLILPDEDLDPQTPSHHARIVTKIFGDGSFDCTYLVSNDPWDGGQIRYESFKDFNERYQQSQAAVKLYYFQ